ncbi:hypothetical protein IKJ53_06715 [bacterium]|nr:hypothetical protein [bacterium]
MTEINKKNVKFNPQVNLPKVSKNEVEAPKNTEKKDIVRDYKEAVAAPGAEAVGRAQVMISKSDSINSDIQKILANPSLVDKSDALFNAAERAGLSYVEAATFATQDM